MRQFYDISHNTAYKRGMPEIEDIVEGLVDKGFCPMCGVGRRFPSGDLRVRLGKMRAKMWPDLLACGAYPCFVASERFVSSMRECGVQLIIGGTVDFLEPNETSLALEDAPKYLWCDGNRCRAAKMNFEASGYVDAKFCPECGVFSCNISLTYDRQHSVNPPGQVFDYDESLGLDLFTSDLAPTLFFCTDRVFDCVKTHKLTNVAFRPVEEGIASEPLRI